MRDRAEVLGGGAVADAVAADMLRDPAAFMSALRDRPVVVVDGERIDRIVAIDAMTAALAAARAEEAAAFYESQLAAQRAAGLSSRRLGTGIADQIALARKVSPSAGQQLVSMAQTLTTEMPCMHESMRSGEVSEWVATLVIKEASELSADDRRRLDRELTPRLRGLSPKEASTAARSLAYQLDPPSILRRGRRARCDRRVSIRPALDTMTLLTGFLPVEQGVAAWASLDRHAKALHAAGDTRTLDQIRADTLVERVTGQATASAVPVEIGVTMTLESMLGSDDAPAQIPGHGPLPVEIARELAGNVEAARSIRRLFVDPMHGTLVGLDTKRRRFDGALARFITRRDQVCRTPSCTAQIRHLDHIEAHHAGGPTSATNGQGLCERGSYAKEAPGWSYQVLADRPHTTQVTTPTGHVYRSTSPPALGP